MRVFSSILTSSISISWTLPIVGSAAIWQENSIYFKLFAYGTPTSQKRKVSLSSIVMSSPPSSFSFLRISKPCSFKMRCSFYRICRPLVGKMTISISWWQRAMRWSSYTTTTATYISDYSFNFAHILTNYNN